MNQQILKYLKSYSYDTLDVNRLIVSSFLKVNDIANVQNHFIRTFIITPQQEEEHAHLERFVIHLKDHKFAIEDLIEFFEFVISPSDKEVNGAVYTPSYIRMSIVDQAINKRKLTDSIGVGDLIFADISCGCGGFFKTITEVLRRQTNKSFFRIFDENIFGLDIQEYSIVRTKILLCLIAIIEYEDQPYFKFNLYHGDALNFDWREINKVNVRSGFDIIVGNPPYVGVTKMAQETRNLLKLWSVSLSGKPDLYIPFFEVGLENINPNGVLGYITVNTFFKSINGRLLRSYFSKNEYELSIIDFGGEQVFKKRSTYTCICIASKKQKAGVKYVRIASNRIDKIEEKDFIKIDYSKLDDYNGWHLTQANESNLIYNIEHAGTSLGELFTIRNGFATLKNHIFVFKPVRESPKYFFLLKNGVEYQIEKGICRDTIKPNTLRSELEIANKIEKIIFPYNTVKRSNDLFDKEQVKLEILEESNFHKQFPYAYNYLLEHKQALAERDRGNKVYEEWYAFGRNQALTISGYKLLFPYISSKPCFVFTDIKDLLFYNGYAIISDSKFDLLVLQKILMSSIFWYYIKHTSKPYSSDFFSIAKNYIKNFSICNLSDNEKQKLLTITDTAVLESFLQKKYNVEIS